MAKRALILIAIFLTFFSHGTRSVSAQPAEDDDPTDGEISNELWTYQGDQALIDQYVDATRRCDTPSLECLVFYTVNYTAIQLTNSIAPIGGNPADSANSNGNPVGLESRGGIVPGLSYLIGIMYENPAANTHTYVADVLNSAGVAVAPPAYAQGLGFVALDPILNLWKTFRNIAYMFYVLMFIVIGFLIMFRQKVGQQAITAQQAIPSIIISLLFVTFSYAIAGLLIDFMYLSMYLMLGIFNQVAQIEYNIINYNIFRLGLEFITGSAQTGFSVAGNIVEHMIQESLSLQQGSLISEGLGWVAGITVGLVIAVAVLIATFKLFFELLKSYATIVLSVVTAPIQLMVGAIPGRNTFGPWLKNLIANLASFPAVLMAAIMFKIFSNGLVSTDSGGFMPPFLVGRGQSGAIASIMGLAILLAMPEIVKKIKESLGATGGFGEMVAGAAGDRFRAGYQKTKTAVQQPLSFTGLGPESRTERFLIGPRSYRQRQKELQILAPPDKARTISTYGGVVGGWEKRFGKVHDAIKQLESEKEQTTKAKEAIKDATTSSDEAKQAQQSARKTFGDGS